MDVDIILSTGSNARNKQFQWLGRTVQRAGLERCLNLTLSSPKICPFDRINQFQFHKTLKNILNSYLKFIYGFFLGLVELLLVYCFDCLESICLIDVSSVTTRYLALPRIITGFTRCLPKKFTTRNVQLRNLKFKFQFFTCIRTFLGTLFRTHHVKMINLTRLFTGLPGNVFLVDLVSS